MKVWYEDKKLNSVEGKEQYQVKISDVWQTEMHTVELLVPEPLPS
jgi:hypothetical protein